MGYDVCVSCDIPEPIYPDDFCCGDCACYTCKHNHDCDGQCAPNYKEE